MNKAHDMLQSPQCSSWQGYANHVYDGRASSFTHVSPMQHGYMSAHFHTHDEMMHDAHFHTHDAWSSFMPINIRIHDVSLLYCYVYFMHDVSMMQPT